jgi:hypothetical protein
MTEMTIEQFGSIGEVVGAIATVATLLYLAVQIRQNTRTVRSASISSYVQASGNVMTMLAENAEVCDLYYKGLESPNLLTDSERRRFYVTIGNYIMWLLQADQMTSEGTLPHGLAHQYATQLEWLVCQPGFQLWFEHWGDTLPPDFQKKITDAKNSGIAAGRFGIFSEGRNGGRQPVAPVASL